MLDTVASPGLLATSYRRPRSREDDDAFLARLEAVEKATIYALGDRRLSQEDARRLVALAVDLARGGGLVDLTTGEGLAALRHHDIKFGYNGIGDLAREELGIADAQARWLAGMAERLAVRPLLRAAVVSGDLSLRKADAVVDAAVGEHEAYWVERAKHDTVVRLEALAKPGASPPPVDWRLFVEPAHREQVKQAMSNAAMVLGNLDASLEQRISAVSMEWLCEFPLPEDADGPLAPPGSPEALAAARAAVGAEPAPAGAVPVTAPPPPAWPRPARPRKLLRLLKRLVHGRVADDERLGRACGLVRSFHAWKITGCRGFEAFCVEKLGMAPSTVRQRIKLEGALRRLPPLREALRSGELSYEQARAVARVATVADVAERIAEAAARPCIDTQREVRDEVDRQMWREGRVRATVSVTTDELFEAAVRSARLVVRRPIAVSAALHLMSVHFNKTWQEATVRIERAMHPVMRAARGRCQVPGCSHRAEHLHHVVLRSRGGGNGRTNLVAVCQAHHLAAIHEGYIVVTGTGPDRLVWEFPWRDGEEPDEDGRAPEEPSAPVGEGLDAPGVHLY